MKTSNLTKLNIIINRARQGSNLFLYAVTLTVPHEKAMSRHKFYKLVIPYQSSIGGRWLGTHQFTKIGTIHYHALIISENRIPYGSFHANWPYHAWVKSAVTPIGWLLYATRHLGKRSSMRSFYLRTFLKHMELAILRTQPKNPIKDSPASQLTLTRARWIIRWL